MAGGTSGDARIIMQAGGEVVDGSRNASVSGIPYGRPVFFLAGYRVAVESAIVVNTHAPTVSKPIVGYTHDTDTNEKRVRRGGVKEE